MERDRAMVENELILTRHDMVLREALNRGVVLDPYSHPQPLATLQGAEAALVWVLDGVVAPGPITGAVADPEDEDDFRHERDYADDLWTTDFNPDLGPVVSAKAAQTNVRQFAHGVNVTLEWVACDDEEYGSARGAAAWMIPDHFDNLLDDMPDARERYGYVAPAGARLTAPAPRSAPVIVESTPRGVGRLFGRKGSRVS